MPLVTVNIDGALCPTDRFGVWTVNPGGVEPGLFEVVMNGPAWTALDLLPFWMPNAQRGRNKPIPGAHGTRAFRRRRHETLYSIPMAISGAVFQDGTPWGSDREEGLRQNLLWLAENVVDPPPNGAATRSSTLLSPDGLTLMTAEIQVLSIEQTGHQDELIPSAICEVLIPRGGFVEPMS